MTVLRRVLVLVVMPLFGYLTGATIFNHFWNTIEPGDVANAELVAVVKSCERHGPVTLRGFGFHYECAVETRFRPVGSTHTWTVTGWFAPEDIGKEYAVGTTRRGRSLEPEVRTQSQVLLGWVCTFVFAIAFLIAFANIARFVWPDRGPRKRRMPKRYEPPVT